MTRSANFGPDNPPRAILWDYEGSLAEHTYRTEDLLRAHEDARELATADGRTLDTGIISNAGSLFIPEDISWMSVQDQERFRTAFSRDGESHILTPEEGLRPKPEVDMAHAAFELMGINNPSEVVYIGDQATDMEFAKNAGMHGILIDPNNRMTVRQRYTDLGVLRHPK